MNERRHVLVTGGAGFIGSRLATRLLAEGNDVTVLDNLSTGKIENVPYGADFVERDLGQENALDGLNKLSCQAVFHLAGQSSGEASFLDPYYDMRSHVLSTFQLLDWCKKTGVNRFLYSSSMSTYGDPIYLPVDETHPQWPKTFYGAGKVSAEVYIRLYQSLGLDTTIFRLFSVFGPGQNLQNKMQGMISIFLSYMLEKAPVSVKGSKERFRDFVYVDDVVEACLAAWDNPISYGKTYNVASGKRTTVEELIEGLKGSFGYKDYKVEYGKGTPGDQFGVVADITNITMDLEWKPKVEFREGLKTMVEFEKGRWPIA